VLQQSKNTLEESQMACIKCGGPTKNGESLCEKCSGKDTSSLAPDEINEKRPKKFKRAVIALTATFAVLIGIVSIGKFFFNRDFMELIQGKNRYVQSIELAMAKSSISQMVDYLDTSDSLFKGSNGHKALDSTVQLNVKLEDQFLKDMNLSAEESASIQRTVKYLNSLKINTKTLVDEEGTQASFILTDPSALNLTVDLLRYNDGKTYMHIPQIHEKYIPVEDQKTASQFNTYDLSKVKYDPAKLKASLEKLAIIYSNSFSAAEIKAKNNQSITIDGVTVQGQKLTASLKPAKMSAMLKEIAKAAKNDNYLYTFVSDNYYLFSSIAGSPAQPSSKKLTKEDYGKLIDEFISDMDLEKDGVTFSAISYLSQNGTLLAHSYESKNKTDKRQLNYLIADKKYAVEFLMNQKNGFTFTNTKTGKGAGKLQLKIQSEEDPKNIGIIVDYSGCRKVPFLGSDTMVGKYVISLYDPDHELNRYVQQAGLPESFSKLDQLNIRIETVPDSDKLDSTVQLSMPGILSISMIGKTGAASESASIQPRIEPSQVLDLSAGESKETMNELSIGEIKFLSKTLGKDPELTAVLSRFGISKEQLDMIIALSQS
jgi:hypothetical protein